MNSGRSSQTFHTAQTRRGALFNVVDVPTPTIEDPCAKTFENLELRPEEMQALIDGVRVGFTVREFQILAALAAREDRVVRRPDIFRQVWGGEMKHRDRAVDVFVRKVRTKLAAAAPDWRYIHTHFGIGYRFAPERVQLGDAPSLAGPTPTLASPAPTLAGEP